jgi:hypothetical protein
MLAFLLLTCLDLLRRSGRQLSVALCNGRVLQLYLVGEIVQRREPPCDARFRLIDLSLVIGRIDLGNQVTGLDALGRLRRPLRLDRRLDCSSSSDQHEYMRRRSSE